MIYLITILFSSLCAYLAQSSRAKPTVYLFSLLAILNISIVAGCRDITVGIDTHAYPVTTMVLAKAPNFGYDKIMLFSAYIEPLYLVLGRISYKIFGPSVNGLLFLTHLIIAFNFYFAFFRLRRYVPAWLSMLFWGFLLFGLSLNLQRQCIALSFLMVGVTYLMNKRIWPFLFLWLVAYMFHKSSIMAIFLVFGIYMDNPKYNKYLIAATIAVFLAYSFFVGLAVEYLGSKYSHYSEGGSYDGKLSLGEVLIRVCLMGGMVVFTPRKLKNEFFYSIFALFICEFILNLLQIKSAWIGRIGYCLYTLYIFFIPYFCITHETGKIKNQLSLIYFLLLVVAAWGYTIILHRGGETYPYTSSILGI